MSDMGCILALCVSEERRLSKALDSGGGQDSWCIRENGMSLVTQSEF